MKGVFTLKEWLQGHHKVPTIFRLKKKNNSFTETNSEVVELLSDFFHSVYNSKIDIDWEVLNEIEEKNKVKYLDVPISFHEFNEAIKKIVLHKVPDLNVFSPNAIKALNQDNKKVLFDICSDYFDNHTEIDEWKIGSLKILPKKGDLSNPNNWREINLQDVISKVVSIVITSRLQSTLEKFGTPLQFGSCPESGCHEGSFSLRTLLQMRKEHDLESWVMNADLIKLLTQFTMNYYLVSLRNLAFR